MRDWRCSRIYLLFGGNVREISPTKMENTSWKIPTCPFIKIYYVQSSANLGYMILPLAAGASSRNLVPILLRRAVILFAVDDEFPLGKARHEPG